jgi:hypothetical protein
MDERVFQCRAKYADGRSKKVCHQQEVGREILQGPQERQSDERHSQGSDLINRRASKRPCLAGGKYEILFRSNNYCIDYVCDPLVCVGLAVHGPQHKWSGWLGFRFDS